MTVSNEENSHKGIDILPNELLIHIFKCLPLDDLLACEKVCNRWRMLTQDGAVWRNIVVVCNRHDYQKYLEIVSLHSKSICCIKVQGVDDYVNVEFITKVCANLISLELIMCKIEKGFEKFIMRWPKLKKINLRNCYTCNGVDISIQFNNFSKLKYLTLSNFGLSSRNCHTLLNCPFLSHILIEKIKDLELDFIKELVITKQNILVTLHIYGGDAIDDDCLQLISQCPRLKDLAIVRCENLTDKGFSSLANVRIIKHLQIWNNINFSEGNLLRTLGSASLINLQRLSFSKILNVSPAVADLISDQYKNLKFLALYQCPKIINTDYEKQLKSKFRNIDVVLY